MTKSGSRHSISKSGPQKNPSLVVDDEQDLEACSQLAMENFLRPTVPVYLFHVLNESSPTSFEKKSHPQTYKKPPLNYNVDIKDGVTIKN